MEAFKSGGAIGREKGSWCCWRLVLWLSLLFLRDQVVSSELDNKACNSGCGIITNISYPFRLLHDPPQCGNPKYELACENNVTILHLFNGKYRVLGINYNNFTIRLVDAGIQEGNCSSFPLSSLSLQNFSGVNYENPYSSSTLNSDKLSKLVGYLNCSDAVREDAAYVDTAPCVNWDSEGGSHVYAVAGDLLADQFQPQCRLKWLTLIASDWESLVPGGVVRSYADIHTLISSGFELSWLKPTCVTPLGIISNCRVPESRIVAEDFLDGIATGIKEIMGNDLTNDYHSDYNTSQSTIIARKFGIVTGRVVLPTITVRFLLGIVFLVVLLEYTCQRRKLSNYEDVEDFIRLHNIIPTRYSYKDLKTVTRGFKNKLGEGGFGTVYKGKLRSGYDVAIKMLGKSKANGQEFISEVATIGRIHHFNVVNLVGFCVEGTKHALVYEFMPNGSLDKYIFSREKSIPLSYHKIFEISLGIAQGIAYLHHGCDMQILHFDIKPHNILLDDNFIPKISDFGLARLYSSDDSIVTLTAARGTIGYMAPELFYKNIGGVSYKADIYSFGMLLMEMASRRRNLNPHAEHSSQLYFPLWIYDQFDEEKDIEMEDLTEEEKNLAKKMFIVALWCIQLKPTDRPSMSKVLEMLEADDVESLEMPPKPSLYPNEEVLVDDGSYSSQATSTITLHSHSCQGEGASYGN